MESDEENPFSYRSLKRIKTKKQNSNQNGAGPDLLKTTKTSSIKTRPKKTTLRKASRKSVDKSKNLKENSIGSERLEQQKFESESADVHDYIDPHSKRKDSEEPKDCVIIRKKTLKCRSAEVDFIAAESSTKHQYKHDNSEIIACESVNDQLQPKSNSATHDPTECYCQNSIDKGTCSYQNSESHVTTISDICIEQYPEQGNQTEQNFSKKTVQNTVSENENDFLSCKVEVTAHEERMPAVFEEGRCPFCQMPFQALSGQSPNWHTMECMDVPLQTSQECPAGLTCDSTIPSHYRRYSHSLVALYLAGSEKYSSTKLEASSQLEKVSSQLEKVSSQLEKVSSQLEVSPKYAKLDYTANTERASPSQKQQSKSRPGKRKRSSSKSKHEGSASGLNLSQGSQSSTGSNSSIKAYFSPSGKKAVTCNSTRRRQNLGDRGRKVNLDPVLQSLVVSDSDSDEGVIPSNDERFQNETDEDEMDIGILKCSPRKHSTEIGNTVKEDFCDGFILQEPNQETFADSKAVMMCTKYTYSDTGAKTQDSTQDSSTIPRTSSVPAGLQKQTSLFSFFKPHSHSADISKHKVSKGAGTTSPKQSGSEKNRRNSLQIGIKPPLVKSTSEPVKRKRVPSSPASRVSHTNSRRQTSQGGQSAASDPSAFHNSTGRQCPFYKRLPGTSITVDAFCYGQIPGCQAYVLTHFHYDHYRGLNKHFSQPLYCSQVTANLVEKQLGVKKQYVHRLPLNQPCQVLGVWLTLMEANHCPGAVIILFELPNGKKLLHTGDFRADSNMEQYPPLLGVTVDELYLDTTYCDPAYAFPSQAEAIQFAVSTALKAVEREPRTLIVCGAYTIGKERIFIAIAEALQTKICVHSTKKRVLDCLEDPRLKDRVTLKWTEGSVHVLPMRQLSAKGLNEHIRQFPQFSAVLAFEPTGWTHSNRTLSLDLLRPKFSTTGITLYGCLQGQACPGWIEAWR